MVTKIVTYLKSLGEVPKDIFPAEDYSPQLERAFVFCNFAYRFGVFITALLWLNFTLVGLKWLAIFDIFCATFWIAAIIIHRKGYLWQGVVLISIPYMSHAAVCVVVLGWDAGFQYHLIVMPVIIFFSHWSTPINVAIAAIYSCFYAAMQYFLSPLPPMIAVHPSYISLWQYFNFFILVSTLSISGYVFSLATIRAETKLEKEHQRTNEALTERNQALTQLNG